MKPSNSESVEFSTTSPSRPDTTQDSSASHTTVATRDSAPDWRNECSPSRSQPASTMCTRARAIGANDATKWRPSRSPNSSIAPTGASLANA